MSLQLLKYFTQKLLFNFGLMTFGNFIFACFFLLWHHYYIAISIGSYVSWHILYVVSPAQTTIHFNIYIFFYVKTKCKMDLLWWQVAVLKLGCDWLKWGALDQIGSKSSPESSSLNNLKMSNSFLWLLYWSYLHWDINHSLVTS